MKLTIAIATIAMSMVATAVPMVVPAPPAYYPARPPPIVAPVAPILPPPYLPVPPMPVRPLPPPPLGIPGGLYPGGPGGLYPGGPGGPFPGFPGGDDSGNGSGSGSGAGFGVCGLTPGQVAALTPLLQKLGLADTGNEIKKLTTNIVYGLGGILGSESITHLLVSVDKIVDSLGLGGLDVKPAVDEVISILRNQVPCLLNTLLPLP